MRDVKRLGFAPVRSSCLFIAFQFEVNYAVDRFVLEHTSIRVNKSSVVKFFVSFSPGEYGGGLFPGRRFNTSNLAASLINPPTSVFLINIK